MWRAVKIVGGLLALVLSVLQLWGWVNRPTTEISAEVAFGHFYLPPTVGDEFEKLRVRWVDSLTRADSGATKSTTALALERIADPFLFGHPNELPFSITEITGYWVARVRNGGSQPVKGVRLILPGAKSAEIYPAVGPKTSGAVNSVVELDSIYQGQSVLVVAWTTLWGGEPSVLVAEDVRLTHATGVGSVTINAPVGAFGRFMDKNWVPLLLITPMLLFLSLALGLFIAWSTDGQSESDTQSTTSGKQPPRRRNAKK
jgi:hypothetical protein